MTDLASEWKRQTEAEGAILSEIARSPASKVRKHRVTVAWSECSLSLVAEAVLDAVECRKVAAFVQTLLDERSSEVAETNRLGA